MRFLAVVWRDVVDTPAQEEIEAVLDGDGNVVTPAVPAVPATFRPEVANMYVEEDESTVARNLANGEDIAYYQIEEPTNRNTPMVLHRANLKAGPRQPAPPREVAVVEANGADIGSAVVDA